ncbi:MAG: FG-GAP repeat domain-containing protein, partial [Planctomycetota bacterium]
LEYPRPIDVGGSPSAVAVGRAAGSDAPRLYCTVRGHAEAGKGPVELVTLIRGEQGYGVAGRQALEALKEPPADLLPVDADGDGATDLLAFPEYQPPLLLVQDAEGRFEIVSERPDFHKHMLRNLKRPAVVTAPPRAGEAPALHLASGNLVRAVRYDGANLVVQDQFSSTNPRSAYVALAAIDLEGDGEMELLAADYASKWLSVLRRDEKGVYQVARNIEIGPFEFLGLTTADIDGDGSAEVLIVGQQKLGVLFLSGGGPELKEIATIETDQKDTTYAQVLIDDLNDDGQNELLLREVQRHQLEAFRRTPQGEWQRGMRFKVFEGRTFQRRESAALEPREVVTAELTGDGLTDIAIIVHDRVVVYPQQRPPAPAADAPAGG